MGALAYEPTKEEQDILDKLDTAKVVIIDKDFTSTDVFGKYVHLTKGTYSTYIDDNCSVGFLLVDINFMEIAQNPEYYRIL